MIALLLLACAADPKGEDTADAAAAAPYRPPAERGPHLVGTEELSLVGRTGVTLPLQVWFPATEASETVYRYDNLVAGTAYEGGQPDCSTVRPVLMFSHGNTGVRFQSIFLAEHLASRGWIVAAPDHTGNTLFDNSTPRSELVVRRPQDISDAYDALAREIAGPGGLLSGCVDEAEGFAIAGHSFGGYTTFALAGAPLVREATADYCESVGGGWLCDDVAAAFAAAGDPDAFDLADDRAWAAISMTPAGLEALYGGLDDIALPTLVLGGSLDSLTPVDSMVGPMYDRLLTTPRHLGVIEGAGHYTFSDACAFAPTFEDCEAPFLAPEQAHVLINTVSVAFLDLHLGEDEAAAYLPPEDPLLSWQEVQ